jgi:DNA repair exonuclease SbcCD ATPase subunit
MMAPRIGKLFVFLNLIAAVGLVAWAVSLTSNALDWTDTAADYREADENPDANDTNNLKRLASKVTKLNEGIKAAQNGLAAKSALVLNAETERDARFAALQRRLTDARTGRFRTLVYGRNSGLLDLTPNNGTDVLGIDNKPLIGIDTISRDIEQSVATQAALIKESLALRKQFETLTAEITQLDEEIERQKVILANGLVEGKYLADRLTDWDEQVRTLERRAKQLADRIAEINAAPKKAIEGRISSNVRP